MSGGRVSDVVVLRRVPYGESDLILTLLSSDLGKLSAIARGARSSRRRFGASLDLCTVSRADLRRRSGARLCTISSASVVRSYASLAADLAALSHASYGIELVRELVAEEQPEPVAFELLVELWAALADAGAAAPRLRVFELHLLAALGFAPVLSECARCGEVQLGPRAVVDPAQGGAVCSRCAASVRGHRVLPLASEVKEALLLAQEATSVRAGPDRDADPEVGTQVRDIVQALLLQHLGKPLRSVEFIAKVSAGPRV